MPVITGENPNKYDLSIYDRWGKRVFETTDISKGWNGNIENGKIAKQDVYTWIMIVWDTMGNKYKTVGRVTLLN
jgi:gliding motility-associated-like protein